MGRTVVEIATSIEEAVAYGVVNLVYFVCVILIRVFHLEPFEEPTDLSQ